MGNLKDNNTSKLPVKSSSSASGTSTRLRKSREDDGPFKKARYTWQIKGSRTHSVDENPAERARRDNFIRKCRAMRGAAEVIMNCCNSTPSDGTTRWHARQVTQSTFDNTINRAVEEARNADGLLEDEAVSYAIQNHGLNAVNKELSHANMQEGMPVFKMEHTDLIDQAVSLAIESKGLSIRQMQVLQDCQK